MNSLEATIIRGAVKARKRDAQMTDGLWLSHGPEAFLQVVVAQEIAKLGHFVFIDSSNKKVRAAFERGPGRPPKDLKRRPDILVWHKSSDTLRAVVEIKRAWNLSPVRRDARRVEGHLKKKDAASAGYILAYSEAKGKSRLKTLERRFRRWAGALSWTLLGSKTGTSDDPDWAWGFGLLRTR